MDKCLVSRTMIVFSAARHVTQIGNAINYKIGNTQAMIMKQDPGEVQENTHFWKRREEEYTNNLLIFFINAPRSTKSKQDKLYANTKLCATSWLITIN